MTRENKIAFNPDTYLQRPWRAPIEVPEILIPYYEGKKVVDIGHGLGDFMPIWAKHAKEVVGYEGDVDRYKGISGFQGVPYYGLGVDPPKIRVAADREDIKALDNVTLLHEFASPESIVEADLYYAWGLCDVANSYSHSRYNSDGGDPYKNFIKGMRSRGMKGIFAQYAGWVDSPSDPMGKIVEEEDSLATILFNPKELDNRPLLAELDGKECKIVLYEL